MNIQKGYKNSPIGVIPEEWEVKKLGECLKVKHGKNQKKIEILGGKYPILGTGGQIGTTNTFLFNEPSVLIGRKGTIDKPRYMDTPFWTVDTLFYTEIKKECFAIFLYHSFLMIDWYNYNEASGVPSLSAKTIESIKIALPPLPEQRRIAALLSTWDKGIDTLSALLTQLQNRKKYLAQQLLSGKKRLEGFEGENKTHKTEFGMSVPKDWDIVTVNNIFEERYEKSNDQLLFPLYSLTIEHGLTEKTERYERSFLLKDMENNLYKIVHPNDIVFNPMNLRFGAICKSFLNKKVSVSAYYNIIKQKSDKVNINFYDKLFKTEIYNNFYERIAIGSLNEKKRVHLSNFLKLQVPLPSIKEQTAIAQVLDTAEREIQLVKQQIEVLKTQKKGLMQVLLTGRKRLIIDN